ncbi:winged helix-turn-helix transcriptional regulator [Halobacteria archaeon AArc-curdl1]|uniref:Winged helix-turn-helix transcriptional regulator n=1 Tax=Natronosalvus hydrolyticus TaxID=2979988 RepID=A0AAP2Z8W2_9EURY|nr:winged helix-turn-helix transcriptional regulator [Halobacteria archaeon AArc-curdl1]
MRNPDETDLEILRLLIDDARRPFSEIADHVGLTPPAVSDRIARLEELGVIRNFTVDVDRTKLQNRVPVLIQLTVKPEAVERIFDRLYELKETEHVFQCFDGGIVAHVNAPDQDVHAWFRDALELEDIDSYEITPLARYEWSVGVTPSDFTISCAVCDNTVKSDGETARINGEVKVFCCPSCKNKHEQQYESLQQEAN